MNKKEIKAIASIAVDQAVEYMNDALFDEDLHPYHDEEKWAEANNAVLEEMISTLEKLKQ